MRGLVSAVGAARLFAAADLAATPAPALRPAPPAIGWLPLAAGAFGCGLPFGTTTAATFARLADLAERFGDGTLRPTPWRAILLTGIAPGHVAALTTVLARLGLIVEPDDPRRMIVTCPGRPGCASATVDVRADAAALLGLGPVHVSGCAKGCAHPAPAPFTLVGEDGHYNLVRNGRAGDTPSVRRLTIARAAALLQESA
jgi:precorrin-3B synthase